MAGERSAAKNDRARIRRDHPEQHLHQRALARAVLAEEAEDFAGVHVQIDAVVGANRPEAADDPRAFRATRLMVPYRPRGASRTSGGRRRRQASPLAPRVVLASA